ncbi:MAG TPA: hypothetical protein ENG78_00010 [Acidiferrobacteraceae bacterium]|nr:hypothetical protein [Acidiferrobacteraceae bacterium]HEX19201.1 hypothetical protein [Acidiferrobacteraceae bacterium]
MTEATLRQQQKRPSAFVLVTICTVLFTGLTMPLQAARAEQPAKVVWHIDYMDPARFSATLTSLYNMATTYDGELKDYDIRVVFVGQGMRFLTDDKLAGTPLAAKRKYLKRRKELKDRLRSLRSSFNVKMELCNITRLAINLDKKDLYPGVILVQSGVVRITELQSKGYAYLKVQ